MAGKIKWISQTHLSLPFKDRFNPSQRTTGNRCSTQQKRDVITRKNGEAQPHWCSALIQHESQVCGGNLLHIWAKPEEMEGIVCQAMNKSSTHSAVSKINNRQVFVSLVGSGSGAVRDIYTFTHQTLIWLQTSLFWELIVTKKKKTQLQNAVGQTPCNYLNRMQFLFPLSLHCACVYVLMLASMWATEGKKKKKKSGRVNGLIRSVQVQPSHFECASESEKSAGYCAGLVLKAAAAPTWPQHMQEQLANLRQTQQWFLLWLTDPLSALLPQITEKGNKKQLSVTFTTIKNNNNKKTGHQTLFQGEAGQLQVLWRITVKYRKTTTFSYI